MNSFYRFLGATLIIAGTTIGAGMLALPVVTAQLGFFPATLLFIGFWALMLVASFLFLEITLWFERETNLVSMAGRTLGTFGKVVTWSFYLLLLYALNTAYLASSAPLIVQGFSLLGIDIPLWGGMVPLLVIFPLCISSGFAAVDQLNRWLMLGLALSFAVIVGVSATHISSENLLRHDISVFPLALPVLATAFGYHIVIPSITAYLNRDTRLIKRAIWVGSLLPLLVYLLWELIVLGSVPLEGPSGFIQEIATEGNAALLLAQATKTPWVSGLIEIFAFFIIVTSFLGVSMSLFDFLADGLQVSKEGQGSIKLFCLTFIPPLFIALTNPYVFLTALDVAGSYGVMGLLVLMPALMVWFGRSKHPHASYRVRGGRALLLGMIAFSLLMMII